MRPSPNCPAVFKGEEEIARLKVLSPESHRYYGQDGWGCFSHAWHSLNNFKVQEKDSIENVAKRTSKRVASKEINIL